MFLCKIQISMHAGQKELTLDLCTAIIEPLSGLFRPPNFLCSCSLLLQINQQHRDIRRADAGDTARLSDGHGANLG